MDSSELEEVLASLSRKRVRAHEAAQGLARLDKAATNCIALSTISAASCPSCLQY